MSTSDWIQIGILSVYTVTLVGGGIIALLRLFHIIVDIEDRQKRIDITAEQAREQINKATAQLQDINWRNKVALIGLGLIIGVLLIIYRSDAYIESSMGKRRQKQP